MTILGTYSQNTTFTIVHARHIAAKLATDLKRMQRLYDVPSDSDIADYQAEAIELLRGGYLSTVAYGFRRNADWIEPTLKYTARDLLNSSGTDDDPGGVRPKLDVTGASFYSFLTYSSAWYALSDTERQGIKGLLPFQRGTAQEPGVVGYFTDDRTYSAGGRALNRASVRSY
jgi:hypothetical protein